jgi:superfamily II DNA/RNA helicase
LTLKNASRTFASTVQSAQALQSLLGRSLSEWNDDDLTSVATTEVRALLHVPYLVFRLPRVISPGIRSRQVAATSPMEVSKVLTRYIEFPDKKMVQFDSGKLVELYRLLYSKRRNGHKCLIFTQMSRMLDILELFLNLHDFSFVRLDGSTSVDERQKLMDRFNADPKLFCFILSTRSGGLGVNLTGADTVIFYDTDWNPAMDAQAQDRAHRIGQTREVHIYRLVSEGTIEENILRKAQQRKDLDSLVINKGNFSEDGLLSMHSLRSMFGDESRDAAGVEGDPVTAKDMEAAMLAVEDAEDVAAIQVVQNEVNDNEKIDSTDAGADRSEDAGDDAAGDGAQEETEATDALPSTTATAAGGDDEPDPEFELLKRKVGDSIASIHSALSSIDRYAVHFRTRCDPFISPFYVNAQVQLESLLQSTDNEMELIAEHEAVQEQQEREAMEKGEVIYAPSVAERDFVVKRWFSQQRRTKKYLRHLRAVTGDCWKHLFDNDGFPFWQNEDTGAFSYTTPQVISMKEDFLFARQRGYAGLPVGILANILSYLVSYPDRMECSRSCAKWWEASRGDDLLLKVYPVESGIRDTTRDRPVNVFSSIQDAIDASGPGDTIMLYRGHYWENGLHIRWPLKVLADVEESTDCVVELKGAVAVHHSARTCVFHSLSLRGAGKFVWDSLIYVASSRLLVSYAPTDCTLRIDMHCLRW